MEVFEEEERALREREMFESYLSESNETVKRA